MKAGVGSCDNVYGVTDVEDMKISRATYWAVQEHLWRNRGCPSCWGNGCASCVCRRCGARPCRCRLAVQVVPGTNVPAFLAGIPRAAALRDAPAPTFGGSVPMAPAPTASASASTGMSTGTVVAIGAVAVVAGALLAYAITDRHRTSGMSRRAARSR